MKVKVIASTNLLPDHGDYIDIYNFENSCINDYEEMKAYITSDIVEIFKYGLPNITVDDIKIEFERLYNNHIYPSNTINGRKCLFGSELVENITMSAKHYNHIVNMFEGEHFNAYIVHNMKINKRGNTVQQQYDSDACVLIGYDFMTSSKNKIWIKTTRSKRAIEDFKQKYNREDKQQCN